MCFDFASVLVKWKLIVDIEALFRVVDASRVVSAACAVDNGVTSASLVYLPCLKAPEKSAPSLFWFPDGTEEVMNSVKYESTIILETWVVASRDCFSVNLTIEI